MVALARSATLNVALLGRQKRLCAVAGGAYLAGELRETHDGSLAWDHRAKRPDVVAHRLHGPRDWSGEKLWAQCELREARVDAIYGRRIIADLPHQLSHRGRVALALRFARQFRKRYGVAVEWSIHRPPVKGDARNWHLHLQFSSRPISDDGVWAKKKVREWDTGKTKRQALIGWRAEWEAACNAALTAAGLEDRVTLASFAARGITDTPQRHRGMKETDQTRRTNARNKRNTNNRIARIRGTVAGAGRAIANSQLAVSGSQCRIAEAGAAIRRSADLLRRGRASGHPQRAQHQGNVPEGIGGNRPARILTMQRDVLPDDRRTTSDAFHAAQSSGKGAFASGTDLETSSPTPGLISSDLHDLAAEPLPLAPSELQPIKQTLAPSKLPEVPEIAGAGDRDTTTGSTGGGELADQGLKPSDGESTAPRETEQLGVLRRIWQVIKTIFNPSSLPSTAPKSPMSDRPRPMSAPTLAAGNRIAERQRKRAITTATLAAAQELLATSDGELSERLVLRITGLYANVQYVRAIDLLDAKTRGQRTVPPCNEAGERIAFGDAAQRRSLSVSGVLAAQIELVSPPGERRVLKLDVVTLATEGPAKESVVDVSPFEPMREISPEKTTGEGQSL